MNEFLGEWMARLFIESFFRIISLLLKSVGAPEFDSQEWSRREALNEYFSPDAAEM